MTTTLANQLPRINLANGGSMQSAQVVTLKSGQQNASSVDSKSPMHSFELRTSSTLARSNGQTGNYSPGTIDRSYSIHISVVYDVLPMTCSAVRALPCRLEYLHTAH